jgi:tripartite-type tricarboxylate transporter receptor subunit TctC
MSRVALALVLLVLTAVPAAASEVVQGKPDGHTVLLAALSNLVIQPQINELSYRTPDDYDPVIQIVSFYPTLAVRQEAPWKTAKDWMEFARANPAKVRVGTPGEGTSSHLNLEALRIGTSLNLTHVPFAGWAEGSVALLGNHIETLVAQPGEVRPQVEARKMRLLAVFQPTRNPNFPDVPTWKELGQDISNGAWFIFVMPKGTPGPVVKFFHDAAKAAMEDAAFANFVKGRAIEATYRGGDALRADLWREYRSHTEILERIGMIKK